MVRKFIAGDRVQSKKGSPTMEIIKYITEHQLGVGIVYSDHNVECVWHENGERNKEVFDQRTIFKVDIHK